MTRKRLWTCPRCGHRFVTRNMAHACSRYSLDHHFAGRDPLVRRLYQRCVRLARANGPVTVIAQKTRIVLMVRVRFASLVTYQRWLDVFLWLTRQAEHPRLRRTEMYGPRVFYHCFRFEALDQIDTGFAALAAEAYAVGRQAHRERR